MRIITVRQPWASLIAIGVKRIENRSMRISYRGELGIHAGLGVDDSHAARLFAYNQFGSADYAGLPCGAVIAVVDLVEVIDKSDDPFFSGPFGWVLKNARALKEPYAMRGALHLIIPTPDQIEQIRRAL